MQRWSINEYCVIGRERWEKYMDWSKIDRYLIAGANGAEVAAQLGVKAETLYRHCQEEKGVLFSEYADSKKDKGNVLLKCKQYQLAMEGDRGMLIWLGKQRLGQRDNPPEVQEFPAHLTELLDGIRNTYAKTSGCT